MTVYLMRYGVDGPVKIGHSNNPKKRLRELQRPHSTTIRIIAEAPGDRAEEQVLHRQFRMFRLAGEWFSFEQEILAEFERRASQSLDSACEAGRNGVEMRFTLDAVYKLWRMPLDELVAKQQSLEAAVPAIFLVTEDMI